MKSIRFILVLSALVWSSAQATTVVPPTFEELVARAEVVFEGTVTNVTSRWTGEGAQRHIVSYVTFSVNEQIKGNAGANYTLQMMGGTVGDITMGITDAPKFTQGDREILFVENNGRQVIPLVGIMHGCFHVQRDAQSERETVADHAGDAVTDLAALGQTKIAVASSNATAAALSVADFKAAIRAKLN